MTLPIEFTTTWSLFRKLEEAAEHDVEFPVPDIDEEGRTSVPAGLPCGGRTGLREAFRCLSCQSVRQPARSGDHASVASSRAVVSIELEPNSVARVENAFHSTGADSWSVTIEGTDTIVRVDGDTWVNDTVLIPAEICDEVPSP
jgi:hypothetical protein